MQDLEKTGVESKVKELFTAFQGILAWKWDSRFEAVLGEFGVDKRDNIRAILERYLSITWDSSNISNAPDRVRTIDSRLGRLRQGQLLFTSDPKGDAIIFCAWWPWGDAKTISIRIAPYYEELLDSEKAEKTRLFKGWFGI
jgi:hypothetical protein